ncbi:MAG: HNH endonuclease [Actinomycetales bacterium]|nr:HNH endonuclease [Actinomycetales bacterium]
MTATAEPRALGGAPRGDVGSLPARLADAVRALDAALDTILATDTRDLDGIQADALAEALHRASQRARVGTARCLPVIEADGLWALDGHRSFGQWAARRLGTTVTTARREVRLGRALRDALPLTAAVASAGEISADAAQVIASAANTDARCDTLADPLHPCNEEFLVGQARVLPVDDLRTVAKAWADHADPDADDRGYREADAREFLELAQVPFGYRLAGQLTVEHAQTVKAALAAVMTVPAASDQRSTAQRRAQGLADLARTVLDHGLAGTARTSRPHLTVLVDHATLSRLVERAKTRHTVGEARAEVAAGDAEDAFGGRTTAQVCTSGHGDATFTPDDLERGARFEDGTPVPRHVLDRLACDGELNRILFTPGGEVLEAGRTQRLFTGAKRAAIVARDRHCTYPGCTAPPAISEAHHVHHWARDGGSTDVDVGALLCFHHHDVVHNRDITMRRRDLGWRFTDRWGQEIRE